MYTAIRDNIEDDLVKLNKALEEMKIVGNKSEVTKNETELDELNKVAKEAEEVQLKGIKAMLDNMSEEALTKTVVFV